MSLESPPIRVALRALLATFVLASGAGCLRPPAPDPLAGTIWGYVELVPRMGTGSGGAGYGDRRLATVKRFDYSRMRFAVVVASTADTADAPPVALQIRSGDPMPRVEPAHAATSPASGLRITNETAATQIVSIPVAGRLLRLAPGESVDVTDLAPGEQPIHLLGIEGADAGAASARVWVAEGARAEVDATGRYVLRGLPPGPHRLTAWHPRLPPAPDHRVEVSRGGVHRVDIGIGVHLEPSEHADAADSSVSSVSSAPSAGSETAGPSEATP